MENTEQIRVTLLANEGIIIQYKQVKFLIDGIHVNQNESYSYCGLTEKTLKNLIIGKKSLFKNINYVLFTHCHPDHFTAEYTEDFLEKHHLDGFFIPDKPTRKLQSLREKALSKAKQTWFLNQSLGQKKEIQLTENVSLTTFRSIHTGKKFTDTEHFCYLLNFGGQKIFIIGDSNYDVKYFSGLLTEENIEIAFINPLFLNLLRGRRVINKALKPDRIVVYHLPFADKDDLNLRKKVVNNKEKYRNELPPIDILWDELQELVF